MKKIVLILVSIGLITLPQAVFAGKGYMGGKGDLVVEEGSPAGEGDSGMPDTVEGPLNDKMADSGKLFGDLYKILRYQGGETKMVPEVNSDGTPVFNADGRQELVPGGAAIGGEPILTDDYAAYAVEVAEGLYELAYAPFPGQCVQPVADFAKWDSIDAVTGLDFNRVPLVSTYDATWERTECEVGELLGVTVDAATGAISLNVNPYFVPPCVDIDGYPEECTWNGVTYCDGILWTDLVDEVHFGRMNLSRSPEAVLQAAFDEAINSINNATSISRDVAGRLLITTDIYEEFSTAVDGACQNAYVETITKAIDSPLENLALYVKLITDGHLVTPGDQRAPIDRSVGGGIPLWKMLELSDGPSDALRPTVDIDKLAAVFPSLVDVSEQIYFTFYECYTSEGVATTCMCESVNQDGATVFVACDNVDSRKLLAVDACPDPLVTPNADSCEGPWEGIKTSDANLDGVGDYSSGGSDFDFAAAFLSAAADKTGQIGPDLIVYLNSILGINKVVGYSAYEDDGTPASDAIDYTKFPSYFNFASVPGYDRATTMGNRGDFGFVTVLQGGEFTGVWTETSVSILGLGFMNQGVGFDGMPSGAPATMDIGGFTQMADDDLRVIEFTHTYQIPGLR